MDQEARPRKGSQDLQKKDREEKRKGRQKEDHQEEGLRQEESYIANYFFDG